MSDIRIKDLPETLDVESDDYVAVDNAGDGTRKYTLRQLIASVGVPEFVVNVSASGEADKTLSEITSAIASGHVPVAVHNDEYYQLTKTTETSATFTKYNELGEMVSITVSGESVLVEETPLSTDNITNYSGVTGETVSYALDELSNNIGYLSDRVNDTGNYVVGMRDDIEALDSRVTDLEASSGGGSGTGLTPTEKNLILTLFSKAAYAEDDADNYYTQLESLWDTSDKTFTYNLTNCIIDNPISTIAYGNRYTGTIGVQQGYSLNSVTVTMGGVDITATSYSSGTVTIPSVTGNVVITATAVLAAQSITATYTQSGTVYDTDSLDSLKADLVVTANYLGGTSEVVPASNYTLSGTLTVGTSTVTVDYADLTDTFDVTVSDNSILNTDITLTSSKQTLLSDFSYDQTKVYSIKYTFGDVSIGSSGLNCIIGPTTSASTVRAGAVMFLNADSKWVAQTDQSTLDISPVNGDAVTFVLNFPSGKYTLYLNDSVLKTGNIDAFYTANLDRISVGKQNSKMTVAPTHIQIALGDLH